MWNLNSNSVAAARRRSWVQQRLRMPRENHRSLLWKGNNSETTSVTTESLGRRRRSTDSGSSRSVKSLLTRGEIPTVLKEGIKLVHAFEGFQPRKQKFACGAESLINHLPPPVSSSADPTLCTIIADYPRRSSHSLLNHTASTMLCIIRRSGAVKGWREYESSWAGKRCQPIEHCPLVSFSLNYLPRVRLLYRCHRSYFEM